MIGLNPMTLCDGYKFSHRAQYPEGTTRVYSNWTARETRVPGIDHTVFFGLQYFLQRYLNSATGEMAKFFGASKDVAVERFKRRVDAYVGGVPTDHIAALHDLGYIPLEFSAVPEGAPIPLRVPMVTVENTHDDFAWVTNYVETLMSSVLWQPITSATLAHRFRKMLDGAAVLSGGDPAFVQWQGHDFSFRGMPGPESAALSGAGHLLSFTGTDTVPALDLIESYYGSLSPNYLIGASVPATEHSVMCAGGKLNEIDTFRRLLEIYPKGIVSVVSDTWDLWEVLTTHLPALKSEIVARDGKLVIRPDSGDPVYILTGDPAAIPGSPAFKGVVELLWETFGGTLTSTGHKQLDSHIGTIYGDAITYERGKAICDRLSAKGFASTNVVFGVGSFTYQFNTRDTFGQAMKSTWCEVNGVGRDLFKKPVTDSGTKNSAVGRLAVLYGPGGVPTLVNQASPGQEAASLLQPTWRNGQFLRHWDFEEVRANLRGDWQKYWPESFGVDASPQA